MRDQQFAGLGQGASARRRHFIENVTTALVHSKEPDLRTRARRHMRVARLINVLIRARGDYIVPLLCESGTGGRRQGDCYNDTSCDITWGNGEFG
jgi:hypothetical protein